MAIEEDGAGGDEDVADDDADSDPELDALLAQVAATPDVHAVGDEDLLLGRTLGRFVVTARVGKGGMGVVYRARDPELRRDVALKVLPDASSRDPQRRARFLREARAAAGLTHPAIAAIHEVGFDEDAQVAFIAMELIDGRDLRQHLAKGPLPVHEVERLALQIARALAKAHAAGIVHRDLKPENIMLTSEGDAKVLDFGLAKQLAGAFDSRDGESSVGASTQEGVIVGTPGYMAPEQVLGRSVDARTDVFSFGVVVQEMLTGQAPFTGDTPMATALAVTRDSPAPIARADAPAALQTIVARCLEKDPAARFADGRALVDVLSGSLGLSPVSGPIARPIAGPVLTQETPALTLQAQSAQAAVAHVQPPRTRVPLMLGALVVVLALAALGWMKVRPTPQSPEEALRALMLDPTAKIACAPFSVSGDIHARELGAAAASSVCEALSVGRWSVDRFHGPAAMLELPTQGSSSYPTDPFGTEDAARAFEAAAARYPAVVSGEIHVDKDGSRVTLRVHVSGAKGAPIVVEGPRASWLARSTIPVVRTLFHRLRLETVVLPEEQRYVFDQPDSYTFLDFMLRWVELGPDTLAAECESARAGLKLFSADFYEACGHAERGPDDVPLWPEGLAEKVSRAPSLSRLFWLVEWGRDPEKLRANIAALRAERKTRTGLLASQLALTEGKGWMRLGDVEAARTALDVSIALWPSHAEAWAMRYALEANKEEGLRAATAWVPHFGLWGHRAYWTKDAQRALPMEELNYFLNGRSAGVSTDLGTRFFDLGLAERVRELASFHLDRNQQQDARAAQYLLALHEWGTGRLGAAYERARSATLSAQELDPITAATLSLAMRLETLLEKNVISDEALKRFVLATPPRVSASTHTSVLTELFIDGSPELSRRALAVTRALLDRGTLLRQADTELGLKGHEMLLNGDAKGAAALWRIYAGDWGPPINAVAFERAGETELAEKRYRVFVKKYAIVPRFQHVLLARVLAKRGALEEARPIAQAFVTAYERTDVEVPAVKEMKALLQSGPTAR